MVLQPSTDNPKLDWMRQETKRQELGGLPAWTAVNDNFGGLAAKMPDGTIIYRNRIPGNKTGPKGEAAANEIRQNLTNLVKRYGEPVVMVDDYGYRDGHEIGVHRATPDGKFVDLGVVNPVHSQSRAIGQPRATG